MTDNEKLARWQGWVLCDSDETYHVWITPKLKIKQDVPDYLNDDAAAMSLLDTLVEKNYGITLQAINTKAWKILLVCDDIINDNQWWVEKTLKTSREAVVAAVLELIEKEV